MWGRDASPGTTVDWRRPSSEPSSRWAWPSVRGVPAGITTAVFLNEVGGRFTSTVRTVVTAMAGLPSIMAGVFIYSIWVVGHSAKGSPALPARWPWRSCSCRRSPGPPKRS